MKLVLVLLATAGLGIGQSPLAADDSCIDYLSSPLFRPRLQQKAAHPGNWIELIENASDGDEILLEDGLFRLDRYAVLLGKSVTIRSASGNREKVIIQGPGYGTPSEGFMVVANKVTIADLTITGMRNHAISVKGGQGADGTHIYNVHLFDIGTQHIKGSPNSRNGVVACSRIGYSEDGVRGDYINGIDIHGASYWRIRDNVFYNIWGDGSGCEVDKDCGKYLAGGGPAILLWNQAEQNVVERNRFIDCFRSIALGFSGRHYGGTVRNNFIYQSVGRRYGINGDAGISVVGSDITIDHNTVLLGSNYPGAIEIQNSENILIRNNLLDRPIWNRGNSTFTARGNKINATENDFLEIGTPGLRSTSTAIDFAGTRMIPEIEEDIDGDPRSLGEGPDTGCKESAPPLANTH